MGKQIQATNAEKAKAELEEIKEGLSKSVDLNINVQDRKHYIVALVAIVDQPGKVENDVKVDKVAYSKAKFERMAKKFATHGYSYMVLLNDPSQLEEQDAPVVPLHTMRKTESEIRKEVEAENEQKIKEGVQASLAAQAEAQNDATVPPTKKPEIPEKLTVENSKALDYFQLKEVATENKIDLGNAKSEPDVRSVIENWIADQKK